MERGSTRVLVYDDVEQLPAHVRAFVSGYNPDALCLNGSWFELLIRFSPTEGYRPRIYVVTGDRQETVDCVLFAMSTARAQRPRKLLSLSNFYTMSYAPLLRPDLAHPTEALNALAFHIACEEPDWDIVEFRGLVEEDSATAQLVRSFKRAGLFVDTYSQYENWFFPVQGVSAADYFASRPSQVRNTIVRKLKKVRRDHKLEFSLYRSATDLSVGLTDYQTIYAGSWKLPEAHPEFIPQLTRCFAETNSLRLGVLRIDGEPAAAQIWLVTGRRATIYKLAYADKFAPLSAGSILTKMMFDWVLENDQVAEIDYGIGSEPYKMAWMSARRHIVALVGFNCRSGLGLLAAGRHLAGRLKRYIIVNRGIARSDSPETGIGTSDG